jgi:hypothetical protein
VSDQGRQREDLEHRLRDANAAVGELAGELREVRVALAAAVDDVQRWRNYALTRDAELAELRGSRAGA